MIGDRRRGRWLAGVAAGAMVLALTSTLPASAATAPGTASASRSGFGIDYLALGDSVAFGYRPPQVTPPADYFNAANFVGYPEDLGKLPGVRVTNASCPGETTASMISVTAQSNGCENSVGSPYGYRTEYPLHVAYSGDQLDFAVHFLLTHPATRLVSIDIGANDALICQALHQGCTGANFTALLHQIRTNLSTIYSALRGRAHYHGALVLLSYYSTNYADPTVTAQTKIIDNTLIATTKEFGGTVADGFGFYQAASRPFNGDPCAAGLLVKLPTGGCNIHPSAYGHWLLASAVAIAALPHADFLAARH